MKTKFLLSICSFLVFNICQSQKTLDNIQPGDNIDDFFIAYGKQSSMQLIFNSNGVIFLTGYTDGYTTDQEFVFKNKILSKITTVVFLKNAAEIYRDFLLVLINRDWHEIDCKAIPPDWIFKEYINSQCLESEDFHIETGYGLADKLGLGHLMIKTFK